MSNKINLNYLETYSQLFTESVCSAYFSTKKYMNGQEIIQLTPSNQVNFMIIKTLFEAWQRELGKMKSNPFFDYRDYAVNEALKEFMNVLSRAIKIERVYFEPMMKNAVSDSILLAIDPEVFFLDEIDKCNPENTLVHLKESKKYLKWHQNVLALLVEKAGSGLNSLELKLYLNSVFEQKKVSIEPFESLLSPLNQIRDLDFDQLFYSGSDDSSVQESTVDMDWESEANAQKEEKQQLNNDAGLIDPLLAWSRFESEEYALMKDPIVDLNESIGLNQRFMFTKKLFEGNADLMKHALKTLDKCESFRDAIELLNQKYVTELNWNIESEEVSELLQVVFRKFGQ